jgi:hypothetical protein
MQESQTDPLPQPTQGVVIAANRPKRNEWLMLIHAAFYGLGGLAVLSDGPGSKTWGAGILLEVGALFCVLMFFLTRRRNRNITRITTQVPEPYAELQASMARLHEADDREGGGRV